ncbi:phage baseplate assembly protein V [Klebsiella quasipneumoniae]|nr:phage baseplate assembly protein V [Klebsiella quasipneumoniae]HBW1751107.1 phage baseplate assembly protein V [Klebsiella quasipneumoniae subsp. similipneumoniae]
MNTLASIQELARAIRNMIRTGIVVETDLDAGRCRVQTCGIYTDWLQWLTHRAGRSRTWWAPSVGEQVMILALGGELDTAFVLPGIYSDDIPASSASADAWHVDFPDGAVTSYEPVVLVKASTRVTLDTPEVICTNKLTTGTLEVKQGGKMSGDIEHSGGAFTSNGVQVDKHGHGGIRRGDEWTEGTK